MDKMLLAVHDVPQNVTLLFVGLLVALILCLALEEKIHAKKSIIAGVFAIVCLFCGAVFGILPFDQIVVGSHYAVEHGGVSADVVDGVDGTSTHVDVARKHDDTGAE